MAKAKQLQTMTPQHRRWQEFCLRLEGPEGCNFLMPDPKDIKSVTWKCDNTKARPKASSILKKMRIDVPASLAYFDQHGGYCDCEILFNVERTSGGSP